tara:strand:+ start:461 stop:697 length:237 start_codon:yes stop_codon:yes gene_type:complete
MDGVPDWAVKEVLIASNHSSQDPKKWIHRLQVVTIVGLNEIINTKKKQKNYKTPKKTHKYFFLRMFRECSANVPPRYA